MKGILLKSMMAVLLALFSLQSYAYDVEVDGVYYNVVTSTRTAEVTNGDSEYTGDVVIPPFFEHDGVTYNVTSIGENAFGDCHGLTSVTIPNSVTSIDTYAFLGCYALTSVTIPNSVTSISGNAFMGCYGLTSIVVDTNNTTYDSRGNCNAIIETASNTLVSGCKNTGIPNSVTSIGNEAFGECEELYDIIIPNSVTSIGDEAFYSCYNLYMESIPNSVTSIGDHAFNGCYNLYLESIPNSVTSIGAYAFQDCSFYNLESIPNSVTSIGEGAFDGTDWYNNQSEGLVYAGRVAYKFKGTMPENTSITIKEGTTSISGQAFYGCSGLTSVTIPNSVTSIGSSAFFGCSGLTSIDIPNSVTSIGRLAFEGCSGLTSVHITDLAAWCNITFGNPSANPLYYAHHLYLNGEEVKDLDVPNSVASIGSSAFYGCSDLTSVTIPNSVSSIGSYAFSGCI